MKESIHLLKKLEDVVPNVAANLYLWFHLTFYALDRWVGKIKNGLLAVARIEAPLKVDVRSHPKEETMKLSVICAV